MNDERVFLKVKLKTLAVESKIIRRQEAKVTDAWVRSELINHRRNPLRDDARHSLLAYGFLNGWEYWQIEDRARTKPNFHKIYRMVKKYGNASKLDKIKKDFEEWAAYAIVHWDKINETRNKRKECQKEN